MSAPPLLLTVKPGATWVLDDVVPDVPVVPVVVVPVPVDVDPLVDVEPPPVVVTVDEVEVPVRVPPHLTSIISVKTDHSIKPLWHCAGATVDDAGLIEAHLTAHRARDW